MGGLEEGVVIGKLFHLPRCHAGEFLAAITDIDAPEARHAVNDSVAFAVGQPDTRAPRDDPGPLGGKACLVGEGVEVVGRVKALKLSCRHVVGDHVHGACLSESAGQPPSLDAKI